MRIDIITVLPEMLEGFFNCSIMSRAQKKGIAEIHIHNLRDYAFDRYRKVDDYPFDEIYRNFFTGLKDYGYCIKCVFITGITKFTQISFE